MALSHWYTLISRESLLPKRVVWTPQCKRSFAGLKQLLCSALFLKSPDISQLQADVSGHEIHAISRQIGKNGYNHPIVYFSKKLMTRKQWYCIVEKECLAIKLTTHAFQGYLLSRRFVIQTRSLCIRIVRQIKKTTHNWWDGVCHSNCIMLSWDIFQGL